MWAEGGSRAAVPAGGPTLAYFGTYRAEYSRNRILIGGLRQAGATVLEVHSPLWEAQEDRLAAAAGGWWHPRFLLRAARAYAQLLLRVGELRTAQAIIVGYPGLIDVFLARLIASALRKPLIWDVLMSAALLMQERGLRQKAPITYGVVRLLEGIAFRIPDRLVIEGESYRDWISHEYGISPGRFLLVPLGADDSRFQPRREGHPNRASPFRVVYHGSFLLSHGVDTIVEAAGLLSHEADIRFVLVGDGPKRESAIALATSCGATNIEFPGFVDPSTLIEILQGADVCLGVFGTSDHARLTVPNKVFEAMALGKPIITARAESLDYLFAGNPPMMICRQGNPADLASAIRRFRRDPGLRQEYATMSRATYEQRFTQARLGSLLLEGLASEGLTSGPKASP